MREALAARSDRDFVVKPARRAHGGGAASLSRRIAAMLLRHPGAIAGGLVVSGAAAAIAINALSLQTTVHPSPLFAPKRVRSEASAPRGSEAAPLPPARPVPPAQPVPAKAAREGIGDLIRATETSAPIQRSAAGGGPMTASSERPAPGAPAKAAPKDPAQDAARAGDGLTATGTVRPDPQRSLAMAQRALTKLGYGPIKTDGLMGPETRQAIERFERDRRLAVTGELGSRTLRELAGVAGVTLE